MDQKELFHLWFKTLSVRCNNYELKQAILIRKSSLFFTQNLKSIFDWKELFRWSKWKWFIYFNQKKNKEPYIKIFPTHLKNIVDKNAYGINFSVEDKRHFLHIANIVKQDANALVFTVLYSVYEYYAQKNIPVVFLDISKPWYWLKDFGVEKNPQRKDPLIHLDCNCYIAFSQTASLIDLLTIICERYGYPSVLTTLQDYHTCDFAMARYFKNKVPTITLQHGLASKVGLGVWQYLLSDWMIVWGEKQARIIEDMGVARKKLKILGTAKYDEYLSLSPQEEDKLPVILISVIIFSLEYEKKLVDFLSALIKETKWKSILRFHPGISYKNKNHLVHKLQNKNVPVIVSEISDPLLDIARSKIVLTTRTSFAIEAMLLQKYIIEYHLDSDVSESYVDDYRDFCCNTWGVEETLARIKKALSDNEEYQRNVLVQTKSLSNEIISPPSGQRILDFIKKVKK